MYLAIERDGWRTGAQAQTVDRLGGQCAVWRGVAQLQTVVALQCLDQRIAAHGLTGLGAAQLNHVLSRWRGAKVMIEGEHTMDFRARQIQPLCDIREARRGNEAQAILNRMQNREQRSRPRVVLIKQRKNEPMPAPPAPWVLFQSSQKGDGSTWHAFVLPAAAH